MVPPFAVGGGKDVMSPPQTFELKGQPKLAVIHTRIQYVLGIQQMSTI